MGLGTGNCKSWGGLCHNTSKGLLIMTWTSFFLFFVPLTFCCTGMALPSSWHFARIHSEICRLGWRLRLLERRRSALGLTTLSMQPSSKHSQVTYLVHEDRGILQGVIADFWLGIAFVGCRALHMGRVFQR
jgi:hypothetical protein